MAYVRAMQGDVQAKYGLAWCSTAILGSWNSHLVGGFNPSDYGMIIPNIWKVKHVPNHTLQLPFLLGYSFAKPTLGHLGPCHNNSPTGAEGPNVFHVLYPPENENTWLDRKSHV